MQPPQDRMLQDVFLVGATQVVHVYFSPRLLLQVTTVFHALEFLGTV